MGLYVNISINDHSIGLIEIVRITNTGTAVIDPELVSKYEIRYYDTAGLVGIPAKPYHVVHTDHRYGDGALELLRKATQLLRAEGVQ